MGKNGALELLQLVLFVRHRFQVLTQHFIVFLTLLLYPKVTMGVDVTVLADPYGITYDILDRLIHALAEDVRGVRLELWL